MITSQRDAGRPITGGAMVHATPRDRDDVVDLGRATRSAP
jgi:hypothetical protein